MGNQQPQFYGTLFPGKSYTFVMLAVLFLLESVTGVVPSKKEQIVYLYDGQSIIRVFLRVF